MAKLQSYSDLQTYSVRRLTGGITNLELSDEAIKDGIDDAFQLFFEFHYNGYEEQYLPIQIHSEDASRGYIDLNNIKVTGSEFFTPETAPETTFETSLTSAEILKYHYVDPNVIYTDIVVERVIRDAQGVLTSLTTLTPNAGTDGFTIVKNIGDDNFTITLTESIDTNDQLRLKETHLSEAKNIIAVSDVKAGSFPNFYLKFSGGVKVGFASFIDDVIGMNSGTLSYFHYTREYLDQIERYFTKKYNYSHNPINNRLVIHQDLTAEDVIIVKTYRQLANLDDVQTLDASSGIADIYNDRWMKAMATAQIKQRWGWWHKYDDVQLPGGKAVQGQKLYDEATDEIEKLREELELTYQDPIDFFVG